MIEIPKALNNKIYQERIIARDNSDKVISIDIDINEQFYEELVKMSKESNISPEDMLYNIICDKILELQEKPDFVEKVIDKCTFNVCEELLETHNYILLDDKFNKDKMVVNNFSKYKDSVVDKEYKNNFNIGFEQGKLIGQNQVINNIIKSDNMKKTEKLEIISNIVKN